MNGLEESAPVKLNKTRGRQNERRDSMNSEAWTVHAGTIGIFYHINADNHDDFVKNYEMLVIADYTSTVVAAICCSVVKTACRIKWLLKGILQKAAHSQMSI